MRVVTGTTLLFVLDYAAMGRPYRPKRLHRQDCPHPSVGSAWRPATSEELKTLPPCKDCQEKD